MKTYTKKQQDYRKLQQRIILTYRANLIDEMNSYKCSTNPKYDKCIDPTNIHCDTIDLMIKTVVLTQKIWVK